MVVWITGAGRIKKSGWTFHIGGYAGYRYSESSSSATGNSVIISGGTVGSWVYGGYVIGNIETGVSGDATGNNVEISGGTVGETVGWSLALRSHFWRRTKPPSILPACRTHACGH